MNWDAKTMKEEFDRKPGLNPASWKYGIGWIDGPLQQKRAPDLHRQRAAMPGTWMDGPRSPWPSAPELAEIYQLDMWLNPHGFLKAAQLPGANPTGDLAMGARRNGTRRSRGARRKKSRSSRSPSTGRFRVDATINKEHMLQRIHTWVADPVLGDLNYEHEFTNASYVDLGNGIRFPTGWHSHQGWDDNYGAQAASAGHNAFGGTLKDIRANVCPEPVRRARGRAEGHLPGSRGDAAKLADGVYLLGGGTHNSIAIEFKDFIAVFEAPLNEARSLAVIEEIVRLIPDKPIRCARSTRTSTSITSGDCAPTCTSARRSSRTSRTSTSTAATS